MKSTYPIISCLLRSCCLVWICVALPAQEAAFTWAQKFAPDSETIRAIAPTIDDAFITLAGNAGTSTISRITAQGAVVWSLRFPRAAVLATAPDGAIYLGGSAISCPSLSCLDPGEPINLFVAAGIQTQGDGYDYVARLNPDGAVQWVRLDGKAGSGMTIRGLAIDTQGNYYLAGSYSGEPAELGGASLPPGPSNNLFANSLFAKYDRTGRLEWARAGINGAGTGNFNSIAVDSSGNMFSAGIVEDSFTIDGLTLTGRANYLLKISPAGNLLWARQVIQEELWPAKVAVDSQGNPFMALRLEDGILGLLKYDPQGDLLWTRRSREEGSSWAGMAIEQNGDCVLAGEYNKTLTFGQSSLRTVAALDAFVVKFTGEGEVQWLVSSVGTDPQVNFAARVSEARPAAFASNGRGAYLLAGTLSGTTIFGSTKLVGPPTDGTLDQFLALLSDQNSPPFLQIVRSQGTFTLNWRAAAIGYVLQTADFLSSSSWRDESTAPVLNGSQMVVTVQPENGPRFFRLKKS